MVEMQRGQQAGSNSPIFGPIDEIGNFVPADDGEGPHGPASGAFDGRAFPGGVLAAFGGAGAFDVGAAFDAGADDAEGAFDASAALEGRVPGVARRVPRLRRGEPVRRDGLARHRTDCSVRLEQRPCRRRHGRQARVVPRRLGR